MTTTADFRNGMVIEFNNGLYTIVQFQHVNPGKGSAFVRTKLKSINNGRVIDNTFTSGVKVNAARVERRSYQFLYKDDLGLNFMHTETYEQISIDKAMVENTDFLKEGDICEVVVHADNETVLSVDLPQFVVLEVTYTEPGLKGDTATNAQKQATVESGAIVMVPLFVETGEKIKIDTKNKSYIERVKDK